uniref:TniB family NTP-binding protein n=1 Tax=Pseudomonas bohemica TaxID=2044872 RepID=UPI000DA61A25
FVTLCHAGLQPIMAAILPCRLFVQNLGPTHEEMLPDGVYTIRPAFYCITPSPVTVKSLAKTAIQMLTPTGKKADLRGDTVELNFRLLALLKTCGVKLCELDEFNNLAKRDSEKAKEVTIDWMVTMTNLSRTCFVLAGTDAILKLLNESDAFARRFPFIIELAWLSYSEENTSDYMILLSKLDDHIQTIVNITNGARLTDPDIAARLFIASSGNLEYVRMLIHGALQNAITHQSSGLNLTDFKRAAALLHLRFSHSPYPFDETLKACYLKIYKKSHE